MNSSENIFKRGMWWLALLLVMSMVGCGEKKASETPPAVLPLTSASSVSTGVGGLGKGPAPVLLGLAGDYVILAKSAISTVGGSRVTGNVGLSPASASHIVGFSLSALPIAFSTSPLVVGHVFAADYAASTKAILATAAGDMHTAYADAAGRLPEYFELGAGIIGGMTLAPGTYKWSTEVLIPTSVTLNGGANDVWIFQIAQGITQAPSAQILLTGGALPKNVFWQVAAAVDIGSAAHMEGVILSQSSITLRSGASANSRLLTQAAVNLDANAVTQPAP